MTAGPLVHVSTQRGRYLASSDAQFFVHVERFLSAVILFSNGWTFALPMSEVSLPIALQPIQVVHGVFLHEALLAGYLCLAFAVRAGSIPQWTHRSKRIGLLIAGLGLLTLISSAANARPLREIVGSGRYFLLAAYLLVAVLWGRVNGPTFVLRWLLAGIAASGAVNLLFTFKYSSARIGGLPLLLGQNGPGGHLGIAVVLAAWLLIDRSGIIDTAVATFATLIGVVACSISYSKLAMLMAAAGAVTFMFVVWRRMTARQAYTFRVAVLLLVPLLLYTNRVRVVTFAKGVNAFIYYKFENIDQGSVDVRADYFAITAEIVEQHPLLGVGYGGFYDAEIQTKAFRNSRNLVEDPEAGARGEANPHSSFLYHAAATGIPGFMLVLLIFVAAAWNFKEVLWWRGVSGRILTLSLSGSYMLFGLTLPTLFNTSILYLPIAAAISSLRPPILGGAIQRSAWRGVATKRIQRLSRGHAREAEL